MKLSRFIRVAFLFLIISLTLIDFQLLTVQAVSGTNLAISAVLATTDSNFSSSYTGDKAKDGIVSVESKWTSSSGAPPHWLYYDLGSYKAVNGFVVKHAGAAGEASYFNTKSFSIQSYNSHDYNWANEVAIDNSTQANVTSRDITSKSLRYVRLYITNAGIDNYARIPEFEVWGTSLVNNSAFQILSSSIPPSIARVRLKQ